ncbi:MAG: hypothetical protein JW929_06040 [Anaerolineales bacterium]|nr:hypothetical protein [Anaerolineales bacterium]
MNTMPSRLTVVGILFLAVFLTGYWLSRSAKPYPTLPLTVHKLIALADLVLLGIAVSWIHRSAPLAPGALGAVILAGVLLGATIVSGGLVSILGAGGLADISPGARTAISLSHRILPYVSVLSAAGALYLAMIPLPK